MKFCHFHSFLCILALFIIGITLGYQNIAFAENILSTKANFICLSDIHFDPFTVCKRSPCAFIQTLQRTPATKWGMLFATMDKRPIGYKQDTNYPLLQLALDAAKQTAEANQVKFVLILGDFLGHEYHRRYIHFTKDYSRAGYQSFVKKTLQFLTYELQARFPTTDVYALVGNNDTYYRDYSSQINGDFFHDAGQLWSSLIKNKNNRISMQHSFENAGYYAFDAPTQPNLRIIMLNSNVFAIKAKGRNIAQAADQQLEWLYQELQEAKKRQQKILIAMHIPTGIDLHMISRIRLFTLIQFWQSKYLQRFNAEILAFSNDIIGIFAGHTHMDWYQVFALKNAYEIPVTGVPSISPIFGNNPQFKLYYYSPQTLQLKGSYTYYFPFNEKSNWLAEYNFKQVYLSYILSSPTIASYKLAQQMVYLVDLFLQ